MKCPVMKNTSNKNRSSLIQLQTRQKNNPSKLIPREHLNEEEEVGSKEWALVLSISKNRSKNNEK